MDLLIIGSRGREHALALELKNDPNVGKIYCIPGNGGMTGIAECIRMSVTDIDGIVDFLDAHPEIGLTVISPDECLAMGMAEILESRGHRAFGPCALGAKMETDKSFARNLCKKYGISAPDYAIFDSYEQAKKYIEKRQFPLVVKTNGRTAGKGTIFCKNFKEAENALYDVMIAEIFGEAGQKVDVEDYLMGKNVVVITFTDGKTVLPLPAVKAYKRVFDGDLGMSTAGMGAYVPAADYTDEVAKRALKEIFIPTVNALREEGIIYKGVLAFSLLLTEDGPKAADFAVRFCDVESQVLIPLLKTPVLSIMNAVIDGELDKIELSFDDKAAVCVVATTAGYPLEQAVNVKINIGKPDETASFFHAGTKIVDGELRTAGGRVLSVFSSGETLEECADNVYRNLERASFDGMYYRKDIARKK